MLLASSMEGDAKQVTPPEGLHSPLTPGPMGGGCLLWVKHEEKREAKCHGGSCLKREARGVRHTRRGTVSGVRTS